MGSLAMDNTPWLPQDDLLLKNSIEAGASIESLARGAVEFSRKFSITELQERWLALLYDPIISVQASVRMAEYERSVQSKAKKVDDKEVQYGKRKSGSVRNCYYAMRKRICNEPLCHGDLSFLMDNCFLNGDGKPGEDDVAGVANQFEMEDANVDGLHSNIPLQVMPGESDMAMAGNCNTLGDNSAIPDCGNTFYYLHDASAQFAVPTWKIDEGAPDHFDHEANRWNCLPTVSQVGIPDDDNVREDLLNAHLLHPKLANHMPFDDLENTTGCPDGLFADISDPFFDFTTDDENNAFSNANDIDLEELSFFLLNSPEKGSDCKLSSMLEIEEPAAGVTYSNTGSEDRANGVGIHMIGSNNSMSPIKETCTGLATFDPRYPEYRNGVICCVLNTEDPEVPCNDDIIFPSKRPTSVHKRHQNKGTIPPPSSKDNRSAQAVVQGLSAIGCQNSATVKTELSDVAGCITSGNSVHVSESNHPQTSVIGHNQGVQAGSTLNCVAPLPAEPDSNHLLSEPEEQFCESGSDIPYFSDIESMILDTDLEPADQDTLCGTDVAKYQNEAAKREIIRLEQNARSCMQRDIASHGAFAVLYGRHSKHYIKKPEVLLGRATNENIVDIDLARVGPANKISRRQASIKLESNGNFCLKSMGKSSVFVNSKELSQGQCVVLNSNSFIEIRDMPFIFEVNQARVKLYLDAAAQ